MGCSDTNGADDAPPASGASGVGGRKLRATRIAVALALLGLPITGACTTPVLQDLSKLSLADLGDVVVSTVAKRPEPLDKVPASVYVISHEDIVRSGASTLPEILRLAPNLEVFQTSPRDYVITARGLSGNQQAQNFPNKLLVLIDGRSVYSPIFSGMYWDDQFVMPGDIERIEVVSGPGGALWGANAVNGVINVITRDAADTQGGVVDLGWGNLERHARLQYGGAIGGQAHYRVYASTLQKLALDDSTGADARDDWRRRQAGFRVDWKTSATDALMLQGDMHDARARQPGASDSRSTGGDVLVRWRHELSGTSHLDVRTYYDHVHRWARDGGGFSLDTWDIEAQHEVAVGERQQIVWGVGDRVYHYRITPRVSVASSLLWNPAADTQNLANAFVQDQLALTERTQLTLGLKAESDPYSGMSLMPNLRLSWKPGRKTLLWAAASRAVRTPTPFDVDVLEKLGSITFLTGNPDFRREKLTAYEAGWRAQKTERATISVTVFDHEYDDLRTVEPSATFIPLQWGNQMKGRIYGIEAWGSYAVRDWWRLGAGFTLQRERLRFKRGASRLLGVAQAGDDPDAHGFIRSRMNLSQRVMLDADLRAVGRLPDPRVPGYVELNARLVWRVNDQLDLGLSGWNLLHAWHQEYVFPQSDRIGRSVSLDARLSF